MGWVCAGVGDAPRSRCVRGTRAGPAAAGSAGTRSRSPLVAAGLLLLVSLVGVTACGTPVTTASSPGVGTTTSGQSDATSPGHSGTGPVPGD